MKITNILNNVSFYLFLCGLIIIFIFIGINLYQGKQGENMVTKLEEGTTKVFPPPDEKGTTPIPPPPRPSAPSNPKQ